MKLDSAAPKADIGQFMRNETRFRMVEQMNADRYRELLKSAKQAAGAKFALYELLAKGLGTGDRSK